LAGGERQFSNDPERWSNTLKMITKKKGGGLLPLASGRKGEKERGGVVQNEFFELKLVWVTMSLSERRSVKKRKKKKKNTTLVLLQGRKGKNP